MASLLPYRGDDPRIEHDDFYDVPIRRLASVDEIEFDLTRPVRYLIEDARYTLPLDFLFRPGEGDRLLVGFHGAENSRKVSLPKFQFVRAFLKWKSPALFLSDPTILQSDRLLLGWMAGNPETPLHEIFAHIINQLRRTISTQSTMLVGHSAGGFAAIAIGARIPNSRAISLNGQSVIGAHRKYTVSHLLDSAFPLCGTESAMLDTHAERLDLRAALQHRDPTSSFTFFAHRDDTLSFGEHPHFPLLAAHFGVPEEGGRTANGDAFVSCRWNGANPSPHALPGTADPFMGAVLGQATSVIEEPSCDPGWYGPLRDSTQMQA